MRIIFILFSDSVLKYIRIMGIVERILQFQKSQPKIAYFYVIVSYISQILLQLSMKMVSPILTPIYTIAFRGFFLFIINGIIIYCNQFELSIKDPKIFRTLLHRMFWNVLSVSLFLCPLAYISGGIVTSLFNIAPIFTCFLEAYFHQYSIQKMHLLLTIVCFIGVLLIIKPSFLFGQNNDSGNQIYYFVVILGAFTYSISVIVLHKLKGKVNSCCILSYFYFSQIAFNGVLTQLQPFQLDHSEFTWKLLFGFILLVISSYIAQFFLTRAVLMKQPSYLMPFGYLTVIGASISDRLIFGIQFNLLSILGILLTSIGLLTKLLIPQHKDNDRIIIK